MKDPLALKCHVHVYEGFVFWPVTLSLSYRQRWLGPVTFFRSVFFFVSCSCTRSTNHNFTISHLLMHIHMFIVVLITLEPINKTKIPVDNYFFVFFFFLGKTWSRKHKKMTLKSSQHKKNYGSGEKQSRASRAELSWATAKIATIFLELQMTTTTLSCNNGNNTNLPFSLSLFSLSLFIFFRSFLATQKNTKIFFNTNDLLYVSQVKSLLFDRQQHVWWHRTTSRKQRTWVIVKVNHPHPHPHNYRIYWRLKPVKQWTILTHS